MTKPKRFALAWAAAVIRWYPGVKGRAHEWSQMPDAATMENEVYQWAMESITQGEQHG
jgi:hypothetical protein